MKLIGVTICLLLSAALGAQAGDLPNLVANHGFEEGAAGWSVPEGAAQIDTRLAHSGKASLRMSWDDPGKRRLTTSPVALKAGKRYLISAWLKCEDVHGAALGATFGIEWGSKDAYLGGASPMGVGWDTDWARVSFLSRVIPPNATWGHVYATIDWSGVGTAWIDDISVTEVDVQEVLKWSVEPEVVVGARDAAPFRVRVERAAAGAFGEEADVCVSLCSPPWNAPLVEKRAPMGACMLEFPTTDLCEGQYRFSVTVKSRATGKALIEPEVKKAWKRPPMQCLLNPHSGVMLPGAGYPSIVVRPYRAGKVTGEIVDSLGNQVARLDAVAIKPGVDATLTVPGPAPSHGKYQARLKMVTDGCPDYTSSLAFTLLTPEELKSGVVIGPDNLLLDKGKPWFPMLIYSHNAYDFEKMAESGARDPKAQADLLDHLQGTPFGVLDYATPTGGLDATVAFADECAKRGIRLALSVKDVYPGWQNLAVRAKEFPGMSTEQIVRTLARRLRNHPALAIYYTNDELSTQYFTQMSDMRRWLHEEDPLHPTLHVHYELDCIRELAPTYDMFGPELYPWPHDQLVMLAEWSDRVTADLPKGAPFWGCLWAFRQEENAAQLQRALAYLSIAKGARGLLFYAYYELQRCGKLDERWKDMVDLGKEIESRLPILLQPEAKAPCTTSTPEVVIRTVSGDQGTWLLVVNSGKQRRDAEVKLPAKFSEAMEDESKLPVSGGSLRFRLDPFEVRLISLK